MAISNGNGGLWKKIGAVVGTITAILMLYWGISDRVDAKIKTANTDLEIKVTMSLDQFQQRQDILREKDDIKLLNLKIEVLEERIRSIERELRTKPNDQELQRDLIYKRQKLEETKKKLNEILSSD